MTTTPLRPDFTHRTTLGRWLRIQQETIARPWITGIRERRLYARLPEDEQLSDTAFHQLYDSLTSALESGRYAALDDSISTITRSGYDQGYHLNDLLLILTTLKSEIWQSLIEAFPPEDALPYLRTIDALFQTALTYQARVFAELIQRELSGELDRTRQQLAMLEQTKSRFISIAAHELKTPLTLIQGYSDILNRELGRKASEQVRMALEGMAAGARRLLTTVNDMIAVSQIDAESLQLTFQLTSLPNVIRVVLNDLRAHLNERALRFKVGSVPAALGSFYADPQRLYQIIDYVIGNSIKYTPDGGTIAITLRLLDAPEDVEQFVELCVADTGIGIAQEDLPRIFDKFYSKTDILRHSSSRTRFKGGGSGLGLSVVKGIVEAHGGKLIVESPGYDEMKCPGTTVRILLPVRREPPSTAAQDRLGI